MRTILHKPITHPTKVDNYMSLLGAASEQEEGGKTGQKGQNVFFYIFTLFDPAGTFTVSSIFCGS